MRVLVTGAAGIVGVTVARNLLEAKHEVVALDKNTLPDDLRGKCEMHYENITDRLAVLRVAAGCDAIAHLAALPNPSKINDETLTHVNIVGTQYVLAAAEAHGIKRVVLASSCCVFGIVFSKKDVAPQYLPIDDDHPRLPEDLYGLSKLCNEETAEAYTRRCGMTTICLRLTGVRPIVGDMPMWLRHSFEHSDRWKSDDFWTYIDQRDTARAFRLSLENEIEGHHRLIIAARDSWTPYDIHDLVNTHFPAFAASVEKLAPDAALYDTSRAEAVLGFVAEHSWRDVPELKALADEVLATRAREQEEAKSNEVKNNEAK